MQAGGAAPRGVGTLHERERMEALLTIAAVLIVAAGLALMVWVVPLTSSEVGTEDAPRKAVTGSAVVPTFSLGRV